MKTKAAVLRETGKPLSIEELEIPKLRRGQVLVEVNSSGICHSQVNEILALKGEDKYLPHTLGHEASGRIIDSDSTVKKVREGDKVAISWISGSGLEADPIQYIDNKGHKVNSGPAATFSQYAVVSENRLTKIPDSIPYDIGAMLGCAVPTGGGIIINEAKPLEGESLAIFGIGGIGTSCLLTARGLYRLSEIFAVDVDPRKLEYAKRLGATQTINARLENPSKRIIELTGGAGVDYAVESAGSKEAMEEAFRSIKEGIRGVDGGLEIIAGNIAENEKIEVSPFELISGKRLKGSWGGNAYTDRDLPIFYNAYLEGRLQISDLITNTYFFDEINTALSELRNGKVLGRAVINLS